eukprot:TRINITY_DN8626_c0_g1_i1.p1 TRINITY_DN8626_c0_g1~~TRINITY_DN8626_c0_g1_i1.p1  ORF type:complete len:339 (-),score=109.82 TRINITY_DN8626_c0_g1_i1:21-1037(-)
MSSVSSSSSALQSGLRYIGYNQDYGCFACGTDKGFIVYNCHPLKERFRREFESGIGIVEMLFRCNILALVGSENNERFPNNKVLIWDDYQNKCIAELEFRTDVKAVKLRRDRIVVVLFDRIYIYNFADLQLLRQLNTTHNYKGLCVMSSGEETVIACPGVINGHVQIFRENTDPLQFKVHENSLAHMALNTEGTLLATTSEKGTLIRVWDTTNGQLMCEFRRGSERAKIYSIAFHRNSRWIVVSSDKSTIHIFDTTQRVTAAPSGGSRSFFKSILDSKPTFAQFRLNLPESTQSLCAFGQDDRTVIVVCSDGNYYRYEFDPVKGGDAQQKGFFQFYGS